MFGIKGQIIILSALIIASLAELPDTGLHQNELQIHRSFRSTPHLILSSMHPRFSRSTEILYTVFIDAGSSGSRLWVYKWLPSSHGPAGSGLPDVEVVGNKKLEPGLSSLADDEDAIKQNIVDLVNKAKENVPADHYSDTPIYLFATAGLRMLPENKANRVIDLVYQTLTDKAVSPFIVYDRDSVRILSGEEEGVFMWLAVNYLSDTLAKEGLPDATIGILELGGASTQITFIPSGILLANKFALDIADNRYALYVHSYLDYGQEMVLAYIQKHLIENNPGRTTIENPCMLRGQTEPSDSYTFTGGSNPNECIKILEKLVHKIDDNKCQPKPCAIGAAYQPTLPADKKFLALGAFAPVLTNVKAVTNDTPASFATIRQKAIEFCSKNKDEIKDEYPKVNDQYITKSCVTSLYFNILFVKGYGFPETTQQISVNDKINGRDIDWTLGALLYERFTHPIYKTSAVVSSTDKLKVTWVFLLVGVLGHLANFARR